MLRELGVGVGQRRPWTEPLAAGGLEEWPAGETSPEEIGRVAESIVAGGVDLEAPPRRHLPRLRGVFSLARPRSTA